MTRPRLLDLCCCQGGAARGYHDAGFDVVGVDIEDQPRYPYDSFRFDALELLVRLQPDGGGRAFIYGWPRMGAFDAIHASPPCQAFSITQRLQGNDHPDLVAPIRRALQGSGLPWVIENVEGAPLVDPVMLCGQMFSGLRTYRHRLFESNVALTAPEHQAHAHPVTRMGRPPRLGEFMHVVGNFSGADSAREAMGGVDWMSRDGLRESIPPAYTEFIGRQLLEAIR